MVLPERNKMLESHKSECTHYTGKTIEEKSIICIVAESGECERHDFSDAIMIHVTCEGCGEELWHV